MEIEKFKEILTRVVAKDTSAHPDEWTPQNPFLGHCTVVSLLAQDIFGGEVVRVDLRTVPGFEDIAWHSWNILPDGRVIDFTEAQLIKPLPEKLDTFIAKREILFTYSNIQKRYELLKHRFQKRGS